jgi:hypothetical protein
MWAKKARDPGQGGVARADERGISKVSSSLSTQPPSGVNIRIRPHIHGDHTPRRRINAPFACEKPVNHPALGGFRAVPVRIMPSTHQADETPG